MSNTLQTIPITTGAWDEVPGEAPVPTNVHLDLQRAGLIPDPQLGMAEAQVQWVHEKVWTFRSVFTIPELATKATKAVLVFEGLDTFATVYVDDEELLVSENMFLSHRVDVTKFGAGEHKLRIEFDSAMKRGDALLKEHGKRVCWNGHYSRVYVRKAQYHYGWDWGPSLVTCGPWKPMYVQVYESRLSQVQAVAEVAADLKSAKILVRATVEGGDQDEGEGEGEGEVQVTITAPDRLNPETVKLVNGVAEVHLTDPALWCPRGHGEQNLYEVEFVLGEADIVTKHIGLRRVELVQDALPQEPHNDVSGGSSFYFRVNNTPIFCGGSNWIPGDSFQPRITRAQLQHWLGDLLAARGNQAMVRIWGGGVYESEDFYEICDAAGVLVWQDVATACADYPAHLDWFADSIAKELQQNLERLRWHPSLVIVAGNNEDYQVADEEVGYGAEDQAAWRDEPFPSRWLYEKKYPEIVREVCNNGSGGLIAAAGTNSSGVLYWPGSPFGGVDATDRTVGDIHQWNVWGGIQAPYQRYPDLGGRFISEFGMIAHPHIRTVVEGFLDPSKTLDQSRDDGDLHPQAETVGFHMKAHSFEKRIIPYIHENFRILSNSFSELIYLTQLVQSEALSHAYRGWRARWGSTPTTRLCGGILVWQMNDVWPVTSWAIVDYYRRPKPAFYAIARALRPHTLIIRRATNNPKPNSKVEALASHKTAKSGTAKLHSTPHLYPYPPKTSTFTLCLSSIAPKPAQPLRVLVRFVNITTGADSVVLDTVVSDLGANETRELLTNTPVPEAPAEPTVVHAVLSDAASGTVLARETDWPQPLKHINFNQEDMGIRVSKTGNRMKISCELPVKALTFEEHDGEKWADNAVDVVPGDEYEFAVNGMKGQLNYRWYGKKGVEDNL